MVDWGGWTSGHSQEFRVGIQWVGIDRYGNGRIDAWVDDQYGSTSDDQTLHISGPDVDNKSVNFYNGGGSQQVASASVNGELGTNINVTISLSGVYNGASPSTTFSYYVDPIEPSKPAPPTYTSISAHDVTVNWTYPSNGGDPINLHRLDFDDGLSPERPTGSGPRSYDRNGLSPNTRYGVQVAVHNSAGWSDWSNTSYFRTDAVEPDQPAPPRFSQVTSDSAHVYWSAPSSNGDAIDKYQMEFDQGVIPERPEVGSGRSYDMSGLAPNTRYGVQVRAHNSKGWSLYSNTAYFRTDATVPGPPGTPSFSSVDHDSFVVSWSPPSKNGGLALDGSRVQVATDSGFSSIVWQDKRRTDSRTWRVNGLEPNTTYYVRVLAYNSVGEGAWSGTGTVSTSIGVPSAPLNVHLSDVSPVGVTVLWDAPATDNGSAVDQYRVRIYDDAALSNVVVEGYKTDTSATTSSLVPGTRYWVTVEAHNAAGYGPASAKVRFETMHGMWIGTGSGWRPVALWVGDGTSWHQSQVHVGTGSQWLP